MREPVALRNPGGPPVDETAPVWVLDDPADRASDQAIGVAERLGVPHLRVPLAWRWHARMAGLSHRGSLRGLLTSGWPFSAPQGPAVAISAAPGRMKTRVLWANTSGQAAFWRLDANNNYIDQQNYGPFSGFTAVSLTAGVDGYARAVWDGTGGQSAFWLLDPTDHYVSQQNYGPFAGFTALSLAGAPDASSRALWASTSGQIALWSVSPTNVYTGQQLFGPF